MIMEYYDEDEKRIHNRLTEILIELNELNHEVSCACDYYHAYMDMTIIGLNRARDYIRG
jgi:hypothetical protein